MTERNLDGGGNYNTQSSVPLTGWSIHQDQIARAAGTIVMFDWAFDNPKIGQDNLVADLSHIVDLQRPPAMSVKPPRLPPRPGQQWENPQVRHSRSPPERRYRDWAIGIAVPAAS